MRLSLFSKTHPRWVTRFKHADGHVSLFVFYEDLKIQHHLR